MCVECKFIYLRYPTSLSTGQRSFSYRGANLWNSISSALKTVPPTIFRRRRMTELLASFLDILLDSLRESVRTSRGRDRCTRANRRPLPDFLGVMSGGCAQANY